MDSLASLIESIPFQALQHAFVALDLVIRSALLFLLFNWFMQKQQALSPASGHRALLVLLFCLSLIPFLSSIAAYALGQEHMIALLNVLLPNSASWSSTAIVEPSYSVSILLAIYFLGVALLGIRLALSLIRITILRRRANFSVDTDDLQLLQRVKNNLHTDKKIRIGISSTLNAPVSFGWVNPIILAPEAWQEWSKDLRMSVLQHEVAHIKRRDWLVSLFSELAVMLLWFNPVLWHVKQRLESVSEQACDALAVQQGSDRIDYAEHLILLARSCAAKARVAGLSNPIVEAGSMSMRIEAILSGSSRQTLMSRLHVLLLGTVLLIAALAPIRLIAVEDAKLFRTPRLLQSAKPVYSPQEIWQSLPLHIRVRYDIDAEGKVDTESIRVMTSANGHRLSPAVIEAVKQFEHEPRLVRGAPAPARNLEWSLMIRGHNAFYRR